MSQYSGTKYKSGISESVMESIWKKYRDKNPDLYDIRCQSELNGDEESYDQTTTAIFTIIEENFFYLSRAEKTALYIDAQIFWGFYLSPNCLKGNFHG